MIQFTLKVVEIRHETINTITVCFKQPGLKKIKYSAGQYLTLIFRINNRTYHRPYSLSSAPGVDSTLNITIKKVPSGLVSNYAANHLKVGDIIEVLEPIGDFTLDGKNIPSNSHLVFWGAGSGITPLFSIIKYVLYQDPSKQIMLIYGNRDRKDAIFYQELEDLQKQYPANFTVLYFYTKLAVEETSAKEFLGRIKPDYILNIFAEENNLNDTYHYICGPNGLKDAVKEALEIKRIPPDHVFSENFELIVNPVVFEGISTQIVSIQNADENYLVEVQKGKTILEAGLDAMIDLSYSCQTGTCLLCKARLLSGEIKYITTTVNTDFLEEDECLLCCSLPLTNNIKLLVS
ncbi:MAG: 2Fe-2S iron-sulfur cluster binding domain-containing protein [Sphingobacteriaceae bacterium]|nr:MAG: 2Fe-2S iron-sulfur cluster binding domain-containing protein [Sphingobacteriaceae bacterium]